MTKEPREQIADLELKLAEAKRIIRVGDENLRLAWAERDALKALLREIEWSAPGKWDAADNSCPVCRETEGLPSGHAKDCALAAAIR